MTVHQLRVLPVAVIHYEVAVKKGVLHAGFSVAVDGSMTSLHFTQITSRDDITPLLLAEFINIWKSHQTDGMILYLADPHARNALATLTLDGTLQGLELRSVVTGIRLRDTWEVCRQSLAEMMAAARTPKPTRQTRIVVATDASKGHRDKTTGLGVATSSGAIRMRDIEASSITEGEFAAVGLALACWRDVDQIDVLTDSLAVYRRLNGHPARPPASPSLRPREADCTKLITALRQEGKTIHVHWIRGHNGHLLNDIADRAAVTARRCAQWQQDEVRKPLANQIRTDLRKGLENSRLDDLVPAHNGADTRISAA